MEKRVLLAIVLSFIVLYGYQAMFPPPELQRTADPPPVAAAPSTPPDPSPPAQAPVEATLPAQPPAATVTADSEERDITFENGSVRAVFSNRGGVIRSWRLKKYLNAANEPLELVPQDAPPGLPKPFTLAVDDAAVSKRLAEALYRPSAAAVDASNGPQTLTFDYQEAGGLTVHKAFSFDPQSPYVVHLTATVLQGSTALVPAVQWGPAIGTHVNINSLGYNAPPRAIYYTDGDVERVDVSDIPEVANQQGVYGFAGADDHYFLSAVVNPGQPLRLTYAVVPMTAKDPAEDPPPPYVNWSARYPEAPTGAAFFFGPKDFDVLAAIDRDLVRAIDFGIFSWLVVPLLRALKWLNVYIGNYGWSIIALTFIINAAMFPLRHKSNVSMRKMQAIQPQVKAIQDRYKGMKATDPARQKMNTEMMELYRQKGVNPASGCVPMLLTFPVLLAFYNLLSESIELRNAPFIWWIHDLAAPDPFYVTPILMGASQMLQQKMMPMTGADPVQQKMMMFMPIVFTFLFLTVPAGLALYWFASNVLVIGQQVLTNRMIGPPGAMKKVESKK